MKHRVIGFKTNTIFILLAILIGPTIGLFFLGNFIPVKYANKYGALGGFLASMGIVSVCVFSALMENPFAALNNYNGTLGCFFTRI